MSYDSMKSSDNSQQNLRQKYDSVLLRKGGISIVFGAASWLFILHSLGFVLFFCLQTENVTETLLIVSRCVFVSSWKQLTSEKIYSLHPHQKKRTRYLLLPLAVQYVIYHMFRQSECRNNGQQFLKPILCCQPRLVQFVKKNSLTS